MAHKPRSCDSTLNLDDLDRVETEALITALARRSYGLVVAIHRGPSPDDGDNALRVFFQTRACCAVHNCTQALALCNAANQEILQKFAELTGDGEIDDGEEGNDPAEYGPAN